MASQSVAFPSTEAPSLSLTNQASLSIRSELSIPIPKSIRIETRLLEFIFLANLGTARPLHCVDGYGDLRAWADLAPPSTTNGHDSGSFPGVPLLVPFSPPAAAIRRAKDDPGLEGFTRSFFVLRFVVSPVPTRPCSLHGHHDFAGGERLPVSVRCPLWPKRCCSKLRARETSDAPVHP